MVIYFYNKKQKKKNMVVLKTNLKTDLRKNILRIKQKTKTI